MQTQSPSTSNLDRLRHDLHQAEDLETSWSEIGRDAGLSSNKDWQTIADHRRANSTLTRLFLFMMEGRTEREPH